MKQLLKKLSPPAVSVGLGLLAAVLRALYYIKGTDEKNLLVSGHPLGILVWVVIAAAMVLIPFSLAARNGSNRWKHNFRPSLPAALGCAALASGILITVLPFLRRGAQLPDLICAVLGLLSVAGMFWVGLCRHRGERPFFGCHSVLCLFFAVYLVGQYRYLSSNPQLQDYVFYMMGCVCMGLAAYQHAAFDVGSGHRRKLMLFSLLGVCLGLAGLYKSMSLPLSLGGTLWLLTNLCRLQPKSRYLREEK